MIASAIGEQVLTFLVDCPSTMSEDDYAAVIEALGEFGQVARPDGDRSEVLVVGARVADIVAGVGGHLPATWALHAVGIRDAAGRTPEQEALLCAFALEAWWSELVDRLRSYGATHRMPPSAGVGPRSV